MTGQHFVFLETISGMKRALSRADDASDSDETVRRPTNRANKLKKSSRYAQEGRLDTNYGVHVQRKRIEHAGYKRTIISRNPPKFDYDGDEVPDYEDDGTLDVSPMEENPYEDIKLEHLLAPLTSAADLPTHPSLAYPYYSKSITEMARNAEETLQRERAYLHRIKRLFTRFRGDEDWAPCGIMEPETVPMALQHPIRDGDPQPFRSEGIVSDNTTQHALEIVKSNGIDTAEEPKLRVPKSAEMLAEPVVAEKQIEPSELPIDVHEEGPKQMEQSRLDPAASTQNPTKDIEGNVKLKDDLLASKSPAKLSVGRDKEETAPKTGASQLQSNLPSPPAEAEEEEEEEEEVEENKTNALPPIQEHNQQQLQRRVVTRAQTQAKSKTPTPPSSNTPILPKDAALHGTMETEQTDGEYVPDVHPFFTIPTSAVPIRDLNLPPYQADEIRRQLLLWVQKQEEVVRGAEELCYGLLRADRMRNDVLRWTKAEGHLHEMSDGEDWYDREEWGLEEDLVKGKEEDDDETTATAKKTRQRRADR